MEPAVAITSDIQLDSFIQPSSERQQPDLWKQAYEELSAEEGKLVCAYEELLARESATIAADASVQERAKHIITTRQKQILKKQWRIQWGHKTIKIRSQIDRIVKVIEAFKNVGNVAANADPVHAGLPWAGIYLLLVPILHDAKQSEVLMTGLEKVTDIIARHDLIVSPVVISAASAETMESSTAWKVNKSIVKLYKSILHFQIKAALHLNRNTFARVIGSIPKSDDWAAMLAHVTHLDAECGQYRSSLASMKLEDGLRRVIQGLEDHSKKLDGILRRIDEKAQAIARFTSSLTSVSAARDHIDARRRLGSKYWDSGRWLLQHQCYSEWYDSEAGVLWLRGLVGSGKTCLASIIIQETLESQAEENVAFFYCSQQDRETAGDTLRHGACEPVDVLRSLLFQMSLSEDGEVIRPLQKWMEDSVVNGLSNFKISPAPTSNRMMSVSDCLELLVETISLQGPTVILIDALDECYNPDELLDALESIQRQSTAVKIFLTSRPSVQNDANFVSAAVIEHFESSNDIDRFIERETAVRERIMRSGMTPEQLREFRELLAKRADGMFRWVELQIDNFLNRSSPLRHPNDVETAMERLRQQTGHPSLDAVYDEVFELNTRAQPHTRYLAIKALDWISCAFKPLRLDSLVEAVATDFRGHKDPVVDRLYIQQICSSLIRVTEAGTVRFAHRSVKEYLARAKISSKLQRHRNAAAICLGFLHSLEDPTIFGSLLLDPRQDTEIIRVNDFEMYASLLWPSHCEKVLDMDVHVFRRDLQGLLIRFLTPPSIGGPVPNSYQKWNNLLWRVLHSPYDIEECLRQRLEDAISRPANPIFAACNWDFAKCVSKIVARRSDLERGVNSRGKTPVFIVSERGNFHVMQKLKCWSDVEPDTHWGSCIQAAAASGSLDCFRHLLRQNRRLDTPPGVYGRVIDAAFIGGNVDIVADALCEGAQVWALPEFQTLVPSLGRGEVSPILPKAKTADGALLDMSRAIVRGWRHVDLERPGLAHGTLHYTYHERLQNAQQRRRMLMLCRSLFSDKKPHPSICLVDASTSNMFLSFGVDGLTLPLLDRRALAALTPFRPALRKLLSETSFHKQSCLQTSGLDLYKTIEKSCWSYHLLRDLWPFICPYDDCTTADRMYDTIPKRQEHFNECHQIALMVPEVVGDPPFPTWKLIQDHMSEIFPADQQKHQEELAWHVIDEEEIFKIARPPASSFSQKIVDRETTQRSVTTGHAAQQIQASGTRKYDISSSSSDHGAKWITGWSSSGESSDGFKGVIQRPVHKKIKPM